MARRIALSGSVLAALVAAACGGEGGLQRCDGNADCPPGAFCNRPVPGERGVCQAPATAALTAPAQGAYVGASASVSATLTLAPGLAAPGSVDLWLGGSAVATLAMQGSPSGQVATYSGAWNPTPAQNGPGSLSVRASVDVAGTPVPVASPAVAVTVDTLPPLVQNATAACAAGCRRDSALDVSAEVNDPNLLAVAVSLDLDPARPVAVTRGAGSTWSAAVALRDWAFPHFERTMLVTVRAADRAGNEATAVVPVAVTRLRWAYTSGATAVTSPAIMANGTIVFGVSAISEQLRALNPDMSEAFPPVTVGAQAVTAAPSIGPTAIWVGTDGNRVFALSLDGTSILNGGGLGCDVGGIMRGPPAVSSGNPETAFAASSVGRVFAVGTASLCAGGPQTDTFTAAPALDRAGKVLAATATATATLRKYLFDGLAFTQEWSVPVGVSVSAPPAIDGTDGAWTGSQDARLVVTTAGGAATTVRTLGGSILDSAVVVANGDVVVGDQARVLHRYRPDGTQVWSSEPLLDGPALAPLVLAGGEVAFLVPTTAGTIHAIRADGSQAWSGTLAPGQALRAGNIHTPPGSPIGTAYLGGADGNLYAIVVDGSLDAAAPWPKAHHDVRNTGNAASPLP